MRPPALPPPRPHLRRRKGLVQVKQLQPRRPRLPRRRRERRRRERRQRLLEAGGDQPQRRLGHAEGGVQRRRGGQQGEVVAGEGGVEEARRVAGRGARLAKAGLGAVGEGLGVGGEVGVQQVGGLGVAGVQRQPRALGEKGDGRGGGGGGGGFGARERVRGGVLLVGRGGSEVRAAVIKPAAALSCVLARPQLFALSGCARRQIDRAARGQCVGPTQPNS